MRVLQKRLRLMLCAPVFICLTGAAASSEAADPPDARVLLQGVANARLNMSPFRLALRSNTRSSIANNTAAYTVLCDGIRRQWITDSGFDEQTRTMYNEEDLFLYRPPNSVTIRNVTDSSSGNYAFDPRILGLTIRLKAYQTVEGCLRITGALKTELIGEDELRGRPTWHCRVLGDNGQQYDYWIERSDDLLVLRYTLAYEKLKRQVDSTYSNREFLPLPTLVNAQEFFGDQERYSRRIQILEMERDITIPEETWTLAGLDLPIGTKVSDSEKHVRIGYWNGRGLSELPPTPKQVVALQKEEDTASIWRWVLAANVFLVGLLLAIVAVRQCKRAS